MFFQSVTTYGTRPKPVLPSLCRTSGELKSITKEQEIITETTKVYPRGRGKVLIISEKCIQKKSKKTKPNPSFLHSIIQSNPESIKLKEYINQDGIKRIYLFPEGRQLSYQERLELACSLLITLPETSGKRRPSLLTRNVRKLCNAKWRRYLAWRKRQPN